MTEQEFREKYYKEHQRCPRCNGDDFISTYVGYVVNMSKLDEFKDENVITCLSCGWNGITHDLKGV